MELFKLDDTPKTRAGHNLDEVVSLLQKAIRRGNEELAGLAACDMIESGYVKYCLKRLLIIWSEDLNWDERIGLILSNLLNAAKVFGIGKGSNIIIGEWKMMLLGLVKEMCRATKNREVDNYNIYIIEKYKEGYEIPDYAVDKHTKRGRMMGRGFKEFVKEGSKLYNEGGEDKYKKKAEEILRKWAK